MSPYILAVILTLTALFIIISALPLLAGRGDMDQSKHASGRKTGSVQ